MRCIPLPSSFAWIRVIRGQLNGSVLAELSMNDRAETPPPDARGEWHASDELIPAIYEELRRLAARKMAQEAPGHTLQATALVHEAYLRLVDANTPQQWQGRGHFFAAAAEAMRRILVERARRKKSLKLGGHFERVHFDAIEVQSPIPDDEVLALDEALDRLAAVDNRAAQVVKLCFFVGLTQEEAARELGISLSTAERVWGFARSWLLREVRKQTTGTAGPL